MEILFQIIRVEKREQDPDYFTGVKIIAGLQEDQEKRGAFEQSLLKMNQWDLREYEK